MSVLLRPHKMNFMFSVTGKGMTERPPPPKKYYWKKESCVFDFHGEKLKARNMLTENMKFILYGLKRAEMRQKKYSRIEFQ